MQIKPFTDNNFNFFSSYYYTQTQVRFCMQTQRMSNLISGICLSLMYRMVQVYSGFGRMSCS